jgi:hypothetical protein
MSRVDTITHMLDRRRSNRKSIDLFANKYIGGHPYLCRTVDLSRDGLLAHTFTEPDSALGSFAFEFRIPGTEHSIWAWGRTVRQDSEQQAIEFIALDPADRDLLEFYLG